MPSRVRLGMRFFTLTVLLAIPCRTKADEALEQLKDGLRQSRESITSLVAEYEMGRESTSPDRNNPPKTLGDALQRVKWAQVGNVARWTFSSNFGSMHHEFLWKNEELKCVFSSGKKDAPTQSGNLTPGNILPGKRLEGQVEGPWFNSLFVSPETPHEWFDVSLSNPRHKLVTVQKDRLNGRDVLRADFTSKADKLQKSFWVDPKWNYLVVRAVYYLTPDGQYRTERSVSEVKEVKPGLYFPFRADLRAFKVGVLTTHIATRFSKVALNEPISPAELELRFPEGLQISDRVKNKHYIVDADEKPIPGSDKLIPLSKDEQVRLEALRPWYSRWRSWLMIAAGAVVVVAVVFSIRRYRSRASRL